VIRLAIIEDHPAIADGLTSLLKDETDVVVVGTAADSVGADRLITSQSPDVVLCDIRLAGTVDGLEVLARHSPGPAFIFLSAYSFPSYYVAAVERGARGYLSKMATIEEILKAVRTVAAGGTAFPTEVRRAVRSALRPPTPRESQILAFVAEGLGNAEIAERLGLRVKTVESQLRRMFDRYDVTSRTSLARVALTQGWLEGKSQDTGLQ
jgi:DNA-binding NarL/FixJ family response regulator